MYALNRTQDTLLLILSTNTQYNRDSQVVQRGGVSACVWMDRKKVIVMFTNTQPTARASVLRQQKDGTRMSVACPESVILYNQSMGGVDRGDQLLGYHCCRVKEILQICILFHVRCSYNQCLHPPEMLLPKCATQDHKGLSTSPGKAAHWQLLQQSKT